jgi:hypothetical protein
MRPPRSYPGNAKAAKSYDSGAEQRRGLLVRETFPKGIHEILGRDDKFSIAAVHGVTRECGVIAKIFHPREAIFASLVRAVQPGDTHARAERKTPGTLAGFCDDADNLMPGNYRRFARRQFSFDHVKIGATNAASFHMYQNFTLLRLRGRHLSEHQRIRRHWRRRLKQTGFHSSTIVHLLTTWSLLRCIRSGLGNTGGTQLVVEASESSREIACARI